MSYDVYLHRRRVVEFRDGEIVRVWVGLAPRDAVSMTAARWASLAPSADPDWRVLATARVADRTMVTVGRSQLPTPARRRG